MSLLNHLVRHDWPRVRLGEVFNERIEINRTDLQLLAITKERGVIKRNELELKDNSSEDKSKYKRIAPMDIGYNTMRMWQGVSAVSELEGIVSPAYTICIPLPAIDPYYAGYLFKFPPMVHVFHQYSQGLVDDTLNLKFHHFAQIKIPLPPIGEQRRIAAILKVNDLELSLLEKQLKALKERKRGLMRKLLTGQLPVKIDDREQHEAVSL